MGGKAKTGVVENKWELKYIYEWYKVLDLLQKILGWVVDEISRHKWVIVEAGWWVQEGLGHCFLLYA